MDKVTRLFAVSVNGDIFSTTRLPEEDIDNTTVLPTALARSVRIEIPKHNRLYVVQLVVEPTILLSGELF
ncbi:hypothetical protein AMR74_13185 [Halorubrum tropicale]|uniref:Uncharacterized protein n=1 Tax=Halorubrum tropicale TaxID=1765655 RepID=A0A0M9ANX4_9EURY|nr:hypothetical protein AMR74_13185 [Halorubrum tropicale]